jgi:hypothetical protein
MTRVINSVVEEVTVRDSRPLATPSTSMRLVKLRGVTVTGVTCTVRPPGPPPGPPGPPAPPGPPFSAGPAMTLSMTASAIRATRATAAMRKK